MQAIVMRALVGVCTVLYTSAATTIQEDRRLLTAAGDQQQQQPSTSSKGCGGGSSTAVADATATQLALQFRLGQKELLEAVTKQLLVRMKELVAAVKA